MLGASLDLVVGLSLAAKPPSGEVIEELVKWTRDEMKYCEVPLVIVFNAYIPPAPIPTLETLSPEPTKTETRTMATTKADSNESLNINTLITSIALVLLVVSAVLIIARRIKVL
ncbi:MAG: hypothetical protein ACP5GI_00580 [Sulfolobales archaeon]